MKIRLMAAVVGAALLSLAGTSLASARIAYIAQSYIHY